MNHQYRPLLNIIEPDDESVHPRSGGLSPGSERSALARAGYARPLNINRAPSPFHEDPISPPADPYDAPTAVVIHHPIAKYPAAVNDTSSNSSSGKAVTLRLPPQATAGGVPEKKKSSASLPIRRMSKEEQQKPYPQQSSILMMTPESLINSPPPPLPGGDEARYGVLPHQLSLETDADDEDESSIAILRNKKKISAEEEEQIRNKRILMFDSDQGSSSSTATDEEEQLLAEEEGPLDDEGTLISEGETEDTSLRLLYLAKIEHWDGVRALLDDTDRHQLDFGVADRRGFTALLLAIRHSKRKLAEKMLDRGADLHAPMVESDQVTPIHVAARWADEKTLKWLMDEKHQLSSSKTVGEYRRLPIHFACKRDTSPDSTDVVNLLLNQNPGSRLILDAHGNLPIHFAIQAKNLPVVKLLLQQNPREQIHSPDANGDRPLYLAVFSGSDILELILDFGGNEDVNIQNREGRTPLHAVCEVGDIKLLELFSKHNADPNILDYSEKSPLHVAAVHGHTALVETLIDKFGASIRTRTTNGSTLLHVASQAGHADTTLSLLKRGVPVGMPNKFGAIGLHTAAASGHTDVVQMLVRKGAKVNATTTKDQMTALMVAAQSGQASAVETLLGFGADVHIKGGSLGETALHFAAGVPNGFDNGGGGGGRSIDCAQMLLKSGALPNVRRSADGQTPLHIASKCGNREMVLLLLSEGADPRIPSKTKGETALHLATANCHSEIVKLILEHVHKNSSAWRYLGVRSYVNAKTEYGETSVHYASAITGKLCHFPDELIELLLDYGGEPGLQTYTELETPIHLCCRYGNESILTALLGKSSQGVVQIVLNKQSRKGYTPLLEACQRGHFEICRILFENNARIDVFDDKGRTALHLAAANGHLELVDFLISNGAFVGSKAKNGETPLHLAAKYGHDEVVIRLVMVYQASVEAITLENQTALHFAAERGQLKVSQILLSQGANPNARDSNGRTPLHLAAQNNHPDVVKRFLLTMKQNKTVLTAMDNEGFTCAHIAALRGSLAVVRELLIVDQAMVTEGKTKPTEATALHMACEGGHDRIVQLLLANGANPDEENSQGMTPLCLAATKGHSRVLPCFSLDKWVRCSKKTGLNALHVAAHFGHFDFVHGMLAGGVPASVPSEEPIFNHLVAKEFSTEYGFTPLHMASQAGHDDLVRILLNQGVQVDAASTKLSLIALHLAAQKGHIVVVGMLLSRNTQQLGAKDKDGRTPLHLAALNGKKEMVSILIAQGSDVNAKDENGWTSLHYASNAGYTEVVKLLVTSSGDPLAETKEGKTPLCLASANNHIDCLRFLLKQKHDTYQLMGDDKFIFDLMLCGKQTKQKDEPLQEFILQSPSPIDIAAKLSSRYRAMSIREKERAKDLNEAADFAENIALELLGIAVSKHNTALLLTAKDNRDHPLLDVLIENEQKEVVSFAPVQHYLSDLWTGDINWSFGKTLMFALFVLICPPAWFYFSLPLNNRYCRAPFIKFVCHICSHIFFTILLTISALQITHRIYETTSIVPNIFECLLLLWFGGRLVSELTPVRGPVGGGSGLGIVKVLILILGAFAIIAHILAFLLPTFYSTDSDEKLHLTRTILYIKNQFLAFCLLFAFVEFLDFLTVHHLFGPWAIIIRKLMYDLMRFLVILMFFLAGFTLHITSVFQPAYQPADEESAEKMRFYSPLQTLEMLFFSLFGLVEPDDMPPLHLVPDFATIFLKLLFGIYMMVTFIVLLNLLIAMMSNTYQRIQVQSDKEWKFGRAILIRQMNTRSVIPPPINLLTRFWTLLKTIHKNKVQPSAQKSRKRIPERRSYSVDHIERLSFLNVEQGVAKFARIGKSASINEAELDTKRGNYLDSILNWREIVDTYYQVTGRRGGYSILGGMEDLIVIK